MYYIRHKRTQDVYYVEDDVKAKVNSDVWTDAVLYVSMTTAERFVTDKARLEENFEVLQNCPECDGAGMVHGCFCENPDCNNGYLK